MLALESAYGGNMKTKTCEKCHNQTADYNTFCPHCGYTIAAEEFIHRTTGKRYIKQKEFSFKGKFAVLANVFVAIIFIPAFVAGIFIFFIPLELDFNNLDALLSILVPFLLFIAYLLAYMILNFIILLIAYKTVDSGKIKFHIGLMFEMYTEFPIPRSSYLIAQLASTIIPAVLSIVLTIIFWNFELFVLTSFTVGSALAFIPLYIFTFKQPKDSIVKFESGVLYVYNFMPK